MKLAMNFAINAFQKTDSSLILILSNVLIMSVEFFLMIFLHLWSYDHRMFVFCPLGVLIDFQMLSQP